MNEPWDDHERDFEREMHDGPEGLLSGGDWSGEDSWEDVDVSDERVLALLLESLGTGAACDFLESLGGYPRGSPELGVLMQRLRELRESGVLSPDAHFFIVTEIMEDQEFQSADGDAETMALLERLRDLSREYHASRAPGEDEDWDLERAPEELRETNAEWSMRCRLSWLDWLRELGEDEVAHLAECDPQTYLRRRIAGETEVYGAARIPLEYRPRSDGYVDPAG